MSDLQAYWDLLETNYLPVLIFYNTQTETRANLSEIFLRDLSKFEGAIAIITKDKYPKIQSETFQYFSINQAQLIENILGWIKARVLEWRE